MTKKQKNKSVAPKKRSLNLMAAAGVMIAIALLLIVISVACYLWTRTMVHNIPEAKSAVEETVPAYVIIAQPPAKVEKAGHSARKGLDQTAPSLAPGATVARPEGVAVVDKPEQQTDYVKCLLEEAAKAYGPRPRSDNDVREICQSYIGRDQ